MPRLRGQRSGQDLATFGSMIPQRPNGALISGPGCQTISVQGAPRGAPLWKPHSPPPLLPNPCRRASVRAGAIVLPVCVYVAGGGDQMAIGALEAAQVIERR